MLGSEMVPVFTDHYRCDGNSGDVCMEVLDTGSRPVLTITGHMLQYIFPDRPNFTDMSAQAKPNR